MKTFRDFYGQEWHEVIALPIEKNLSELSSLLFQQRVEHRITENNGEQIVWVKNTALIPQLQEFVQQWQSGEIHIVKAENEEPSSLNDDELRNISSDSSFFSTGLKQGFLLQLFLAPLTSSFLILCFIGTLIVGLDLQVIDYSLFTFSDVSGFRPVLDAALHFPYSEPWRFITPIFLHFGIMHIVGNALFLWYFGARLEKVFGPLLFLFFVVVVGVVSNVAQYAWEINGNFGGFSGVNYAFVGYILIRQQMKPDKRLNVPSGLIWFPIITMILGIFGMMDFFAGGAIANTAHATGFILGLTWAFLTCFSALKK
ncbi:MAG: rhomboid family intramembrane serine protease [Cellvibrionaceae bacterium]